MSRKGSSNLSSNSHRFVGFDGDPLGYSDEEHEDKIYQEDKWFMANSNSSLWESNLTAEEEAAIRMHINGSGTLNDKYSEVLDNAVSKFDLNEGIVVFRATDRFSDAKVGDIIRENGHPSTSVIDIGNWGRDTMLEISVPSGKGRGAWIGTKGEPTEHEFMLCKDASYKVTGRSVDKDGTVRLRVTMEV